MFPRFSPVEHPVERANGDQRRDRFEPVSRLFLVAGGGFEPPTFGL